MPHGLQPLIDQAKASEFSHVVVFMSEEGIHWRPQTEAACAVMAGIIGGKVITREDFIQGLEQVESEEF